MRIGTGYLTGGNLPLAIKELSIAKDLDPKNYAILNNLGLAYYYRQEYSLAGKEFQEALVISPNYTEARSNLSRVFISTEKYAEAIDILKVATRDLTYRQPEKIWANLGMAQLELKKYNDAELSLKKAITLNRHYCPAFTLLGKTHYKLEKYSLAAHVLDQAVFKCRTQYYDEPNYYGALSYLQLGKKNVARAKLKEIIDKFPNGNYAPKAIGILKTIQ